ncbi:Hemolysin-type calcium-binding region [Nostoc sp. DSM 114161]|jgi:Ca2+-binding RTX toxin-like protein|uniref:calcium-binding protein n=1 Tax=Nostoc sp. DSM 114161 TaxID=3440143 RepID=UPI0040457048
MANIIGTDYYETLLGTKSADTISGKLGDDILTGGGGKDKFVYNLGDGIDTITDFGGVGKGTNPTAGVIAEVDTIKFIGEGLTARNLLLTQNGTDLQISFEGVANTTVVLKNFKLEDLENLKASSSTPAIGNIIFDGQSSIIDSFNVLDANSTDTTIGIKNTVTFLNDLANNIKGLDNSNDVINGQGGNDKIQGLSGDDLLRGGAGNNLLDGGAGNDTLSISGYEDEQYDYRLSGKNTLNGGAGDDNLSASGSTGDNLLSGGNGNDSVSISGYYTFLYLNDIFNSRSLGKNTLNGGAGDDNLSASGSTGNNLLSGDDGNDTLSISGYYNGDNYEEYNSRSSGNNTLNGGAGNDILSASGSDGDNLLSGGDGNDSLSISGYYEYTPDDYPFYRDLSSTYDSRSSGKNTLSGGAGNDTLSAGGSTGDNLLDGGNSNDILIASDATGKNTLKGGNGNDTLTGGKGNDSLIGGSGIDTFVFNSFNQGVDKISDFNATNEVIQVSAVGFGGGLSAGVLKANQFRIGASATTSAQRFIYNSTTGALFFDQDGSAGAFAQVQFGQLSTGLALTNNNFVVV